MEEVLVGLLVGDGVLLEVEVADGVIEAAAGVRVAEEEGINVDVDDNDAPVEGVVVGVDEGDIGIELVDIDGVTETDIVVLGVIEAVPLFEGLFDSLAGIEDDGVIDAEIVVEPDIVEVGLDVGVLLGDGATVSVNVNFTS